MSVVNAATSGPSLLHEVLDRAAAGTPDAPALVHRASRFSFSQLASRVWATAALVEATTDPGDRIAVVGENHPVWVECYYGVPAVSRRLVFLNHRLADAEIAAIVRRSGARVVVGPSGLADRLRAALVADGPPPVVVDRDTWTDRVDEHLGRRPPEHARATDPGATAWIIYTSGTTASPKGAMLTHRGVLAAVNATAGLRPMADDDVYVFPYPLCHVAGYNVIHCHLRGRPVVLLATFDAAAFVDAVDHEGATTCSMAATMLDSLLDHVDEHPEARARLRGLRSVAYGAAPMPETVLRRADAELGIDFAQGYGMTELSGNAVFLGPDDHRRGLAGDGRLLRAAGRPAPGVELRIVDADDRPVPPGRVGEIVIRAEQLLAGYWDDPETTATAFRGGWFHTGDVGRIDADGLVSIVDRLKDVIVTGGENVSSLEVEEALRSHPAVRDVAVIGLPDEHWGERVCAVVVPVPGALLDEADLVEHARARLGGFKIPRRVELVAELPKNGTGKVMKADLRARFG